MCMGNGHNAYHVRIEILKMPEQFLNFVNSHINKLNHISIDQCKRVVCLTFSIPAGTKEDDDQQKKTETLQCLYQHGQGYVILNDNFLSFLILSH